MALNFPASPTLDQIYTSGGSSWKWDGTTWKSNSINEQLSLTGNGTSNVTGTFPNFTITSNDEFDGTVTSVGLIVPTGLSVSGSPVTNSGNLTITYSSGYSIPTTSSQNTWNYAATHSNSAYNQANTATTNAATADQRAVTSGVYANSSYLHANASFIVANTKYSSSGGTISGDVNITGNLNVTGNTITHSADDLTINDPLILLANNNPGNVLDLGFIAHYIEGGVTKHTGLVRDSSANTFYLFDNYVPHIQETNILDINDATLRITTLRANLVSDSVLVRGYDVVDHTNSAYTQANTATTNAATSDQKAVTSGVYANSAFDAANTADQRAVTSGVYANAAYIQANTATTNAATADQRAATSGVYANAAFGAANTASINALSAGSYANGAFTKANTATTNAATADQKAVTSGVYANAAFGAANTASINALSAGSYANNAYNQANTATTNAATADQKAVTSGVYANSAFSVANSKINVSVSNDTTTNSDAYYPTLSTITTGTLSTANVSSTKLYYNPSTGQLNASNFNSLSDANKKKDIVTITDPIEKVIGLRGVSFRWKENDVSAMGLIAQEVEMVIPDVVSTSSCGEKSVSYDSIIGLLVEAIKDQQNQINELKKQ
jgi:hypothetical protein